MGSWGITAFESDAGLDAVGFIRTHLPEDGKLDLGTVIDALRQNDWNAPPDVKNGESHTSPMALAEIMVKFLDRDMSDLDYDAEWAKEDHKFSALSSFTASRESVRWLRDYLSETMKYAKENAAFGAQYGRMWNGWFEEKNWIGWQAHMAELIRRMDTLLASPDSGFELVRRREHEAGAVTQDKKNVLGLIVHVNGREVEMELPAGQMELTDACKQLGVSSPDECALLITCSGILPNLHGMAFLKEELTYANELEQKLRSFTEGELEKFDAILEYETDTRARFLTGCLNCACNMEHYEYFDNPGPAVKRTAFHCTFVGDGYIREKADSAFQVFYQEPAVETPSQAAEGHGLQQ